MMSDVHLHGEPSPDATVICQADIIQIRNFQHQVVEAFGTRCEGGCERMVAPGAGVQEGAVEIKARNGFRITNVIADTES